jgi:replicative DNA helicase
MTLDNIENMGILDLDFFWGNEEVSKKVPTSIPALDDKLSGGRCAGLHCETAGPGGYKTSSKLQDGYLATMDDKRVLYLTNEISAKECWLRLASRKMYVDNLLGKDDREAIPWANIEDEARKASLYMDDHDEDTLDWIRGKIQEVLYAGVPQEDIDKGTELEKCRRLTIADMGPRISSNPTYENEWDGKRTFGDRLIENTRYLVSNIIRATEGGWAFDFWSEYLHEPQLIIIDAVNALRLYEYRYYKKTDQWCYSDVEREPRAKMEEIVETLDNFGREMGIPIVGVFHKNRTSTNYHPSMGDFKETSAIEYHAVSALELVRADDMQWSNHPKAPSAPQGAEAVGLYVLKSRGGQRTEHNKPIWLAAYGAYNFIAPLE